MLSCVLRYIFLTINSLKFFVLTVLLVDEISKFSFDMIDTSLYRYRIGTFNPRQRTSPGKLYKAGNSIPDFYGYNFNLINLYTFIYIYIIIYYFLGMVCLIFSSPISTSNSQKIFFLQISGLTYMPYNKLLFIILIKFLICRIFKCKNLSIYKFYLKLSWSTSLPFSLFSKSPNRICRILSGLCCWTFLINFCLITIVNPSLLNPGPTRGNKDLTVAYQNVTGLIPFRELDKPNPKLDSIKILELNSYLNKYKPGVVILNETWLKGTIDDSEVIPKDQYKMYRVDRDKFTHPPDPNNPNKFRKYGGGVLIAIQQDLDIKYTKISYKCSAEIVAVKIVFNCGKKIVICTCYRVGTLGEANFKEIDSYLHKIKARKDISNLFMVGDFNFPSVDWENLHSSHQIDQSFLTMFSNLGLAQLIDKPTHIAGNILDLLLTDNESVIANLKVNEGWHLCKSNHFPITFHIKFRADKKKAIKREIYNFKHAEWDLINSELSKVDWAHLLHLNNSMETSWQNFKTHFFSIINKHIPRIKISNSYQPPWFDSETFNLCREKEWYRSRYKSSSSPEHYTKFSECRKAFKKLTEQKMRDNILTDDDSSDLITKKFWSHLKSKTKSSRIPETVHLGEIYRSDPADQCELFNTHFYNQFSGHSNYSIPINYTTDYGFEIDFNKDRVKELLSKVNVNKAMGPDRIDGKMLKNCANSLAVPLSILFTRSYYRAELPNDWKAANVVPVHKKGSKIDVENYRPISLISIVAKTLERIICDELMHRCNYLIDPRQHGFVFGKSCGTQLLGFCDSLALSLNNNTRSDVIYFDFAKAFDSVNHDIILSKLKNQFNIDGYLLGFIQNYLKDRTQSVVLGNCSSSVKPVISGVPQGSILGPTLFVLFLNDITSGLDANTNILMYADDTKIWREIKCENDHIVLQRDIDFLFDWALRNCMKFHPSKCKALMVNRSKMPLLNILPFVQFYYSMGNDIIDYCDSENDLGINFNGTLNFTQHADILYSKANQRFGLLKRTCHFINNTMRKRALFLTMVRSIFEHCPYVWRPSAISSINKLESIQKRGVKWILSDNQYSRVSYSTSYHLYLVHCKQLNILPIKFRFDFHDLKMFHSIVYGYSCVELPDYVKPFHGARLRNSHLDKKCYVCTIQPNIKNHNFNTASQGILSQSFFFRTHLLWNRLPISLREIIRPSLFKSKLIDYLWKNSIKNEYDAYVEGLHDDQGNYTTEPESYDFG